MCQEENLKKKDTREKLISQQPSRDKNYSNTLNNRNQITALPNQHLLQDYHGL